VSRSFGLNLTSSILFVDIGSPERIPIKFNNGSSIVSLSVNSLCSKAFDKAISLIISVSIAENLSLFSEKISIIASLRVCLS
jgi:hypothetical protein